MSAGDPATAARAFLAWFAAAVVVVESALALLLPVDPGRHEVDHLAAQTATGALSGDVVLLSDSVTYDVLPGRVDAEGLVDLASNQAIGVPGNAFLLQRQLRSSGAPLELVVYTAVPPSLAEALGPSRFLVPYFTSVFLRAEEIAAVETELGRDDLAADMRSARASRRLAFPSNLRAGNAAAPLNAALRDLKRSSLDRGDALPPLSALARRKIADRRAFATFEAPPETDAGLEMLARLADEAGATLALTPPPIAPSILEAWKASGYWQGYVEYLEAFARRHRDVVFRPDCPYRARDDREFTDGVHLTQDAKRAWAAALAGWIDELRARQRETR